MWKQVQLLLIVISLGFGTSVGDKYLVRSQYGAAGCQEASLVVREAQEVVDVCRFDERDPDDGDLFVKFVCSDATTCVRKTFSDSACTTVREEQPYTMGCADAQFSSMKHELLSVVGGNQTYELYEDDACSEFDEGRVAVFGACDWGNNFGSKIAMNGMDFGVQHYTDKNCQTETTAAVSQTRPSSKTVIMDGTCQAWLDGMYIKVAASSAGSSTTTTTSSAGSSTTTTTSSAGSSTTTTTTAASAVSASVLASTRLVAPALFSAMTIQMLWT